LQNTVVFGLTAARLVTIMIKATIHLFKLLTAKTFNRFFIHNVNSRLINYEVTTTWHYTNTNRLLLLLLLLLWNDHTGYCTPASMFLHHQWQSWSNTNTTSTITGINTTTNSWGKRWTSTEL